MNAADFVTDLLKVETPELFAVCLRKSGEKSEDDKAAAHAFIQDLQKFIFKNELKHKLLFQMKEILVRMLTNQCINQFYYIICMIFFYTFRKV